MNTDSDPYKLVRAIGGFLAIVALLSLTVLSFDRTGQPLADETFTRLMILIGILLGLDRVLEVVGGE